MATPTLTQLNFTEIDDADTNTNWTEFDTADADIKKEGTNSMSGILRSNLDTGDYDHGSAPVTAAGKHFRAWINTINVPYMKDEAGGGYEVFMDDGGTVQYITVFSSDDYYGGWKNIVIDCELYTSLTLANVERWGFRANHTSNAKNATNTWVDYFRYSDGYSITGGDSIDQITLTDVATADRGTTTLYGMGIIEEVEGIFLAYGKIQIGNMGDTTHFEMDGDVLVFTDQPVADGLYAINGNGSGADIVITNSTIKAAGTGDNVRPDIDMITNSPGLVSIIDTVFIRGGTFKFKSGQTITGNTFNDCQTTTGDSGIAFADCNWVESDMVTQNRASLDNCIFDSTKNSVALYGDSVDLISNCTFTAGDSNEFAIELTETGTFDFVGNTFIGYAAQDGDSDDRAIYNNSGGAVTLNVSGGTGLTYKNGSGSSTTLVINPVTTQLKILDSTSGDSIGDSVRCLVWVTSAAAGLPYLTSVTIKTGDTSGDSAFVTQTSHSLATGDNVIIKGANEDVYNGAYPVVVVSGDTYAYTTNEAIKTTPATGTITSTFAFINENTNSLGIVSDTRSLSVSQPIAGWARCSTGTPYFYKHQSITGIVDNSNGFSAIIQLIRDE